MIVSSYFKNIAKLALRSSNLTNVPRVGCCCSAVASAPARTQLLSGNKLKASLQIKREETNLAKAASENNEHQLTITSIEEYVKNINKLGQLTEHQADCLMQKCKTVPNYSPKKRMALFSQIWQHLEKISFKFKPKHYNILVQICTENFIPIDYSQFLTTMKCEPDNETYKYLLENACEKGDVQQAFSVLSIMKDKKITIDEEIFNLLILGHTVHGGLYEGEKIFKMMQASKVPESANTNAAVLRGLIKRKEENEFKLGLMKYSVPLTEQNVLTILKDLGSSEKHTWLPKLLGLIEPEKFSRNFDTEVGNICIWLIHINQPNAALFIYKTLIKPTSEDSYGQFLIEEMLKCSAPAEVIAKSAKELKDHNEYALEQATEFALRNSYIDYAWRLLENFSVLRPHYFWPILIHAAHENNELGILNTLQRMKDMGVRADDDTLRFYCIPFCDLNEPKLLIPRIQAVGYSVKELLTPAMAVLLSQNRVNDARKLMDNYCNVKIDGEKIVTPLVNSWKESENFQDSVKILQRMCECGSKQMNFIGKFLNKIAKKCRMEKDFGKLFLTLKCIYDAKLRINSSETEEFAKIVNNKQSWAGSHLSKIQEILDSLLDISLSPLDENVLYTHPRDMNLEQLECHLLELENKNMETRGVLRKLIQMHSNTGNSKRVEELKKKIIEKGYEESPGMKSSRMHSFIQSRNVTAALDMYHEIKSLHPGFKLDNFKILDLATLLVSENKFEEAITLIKSESEKSQVKGGPSIEKNCWRFIKAAKSPQEAESLFELLTSYGYCKPSNILLGPIIKLKFMNEQYEEAVQAFSDYAKKYRCTPLKVELLRALLKANKNELFDKVVQVDQNLHGSVSSSISVIAALAEEGFARALHNYFVKARTLPKAETLRKQCDRWVREKNVVALETLSKALVKLPPSKIFDSNYAQLSTMKVYSELNNCESALAFWQNISDEHFSVSTEVKGELHKLLVRCNYEVPPSLQN